MVADGPQEWVAVYPGSRLSGKQLVTLYEAAARGKKRRLSSPPPAPQHKHKQKKQKTEPEPEQPADDRVNR